MIAPNGKQSNLTDSQYKLVREPAFKKWFGDWEFNPSEASKVVDENGEPLVVYHGTNAEFNVFNKKGKGNRVLGYFFTTEKDFSENYGKSKLYFLNIKNIKNFNAQRFDSLNTRQNAENNYWELEKDKLLAEMYNGVLIDRNDLFADINFARKDYVAFEPNQIKLADGSNTTFDSNNNDIRFDDGGNVKSQNLDAKLKDIGFEFNPYAYRYGKRINEDNYITAFYSKKDNLYKIRGTRKIKTILGGTSVGIQFDFQNEKEFFEKLNDILNTFKQGGNVNNNFPIVKLKIYANNQSYNNKRFENEAFYDFFNEKIKFVNLDTFGDDYRFNWLKVKENSKGFYIDFEYYGGRIYIENYLNLYNQEKNKEKYKQGGNIKFKNNNMSKHNDGLFVGKSHKEGGIPIVVKSTGQRIEVEGGESITNKTSMADTKIRTLTGTNCEIISQINTQNGNGVAMDCDSVVGKKYKYKSGGNVLSNFKMVAFAEDKTYKYYVVEETENDYLVVQEDLFNKWKNADKFDKAQYYSEWIPKSEMVEIDKMEAGGQVSLFDGQEDFFGKKRFADGGSVSAKKIMGLRLALRLSNNEDKKLIEKRIKALEIADKMDKFKTDGGIANSLELLKNKIRNISKKMQYDGESGYGGYVIYLDKDKDKIEINTYTNLSPYSAQASDEVSVSFNAPNKTMIIFSTNVSERFEDNNSFEKYGGIKYIYEPLTNKIASEILEKIKL